MTQHGNYNSYLKSASLPIKYHILKYLIRLFYYVRLRRFHNLCYNSIEKYGYDEYGIKIDKPTKTTKENYKNKRIRRGIVGSSPNFKFFNND